jgi:hypothetical protein
MQRSNKYGMSQVNIKRTLSFQTPPSGSLGFGFDENGNPCRINEDGSKTLIPINNQGQSGLSANIIANRGVGLEVNLPVTFVQDDIYVSYDTFKIFTAVDADTWSSIFLVNGQFVTDNVTLYQFNGTLLFNIGSNFDFIDLTINPSNPLYQEGRMFYDSVKHCVSYYNDVEGITVNWNEFLIPVYNDSNTTLLNGRAVTPIGNYDNTSISVVYADRRYKNRSRLLCVLTNNIAPYTTGWATRLGELGQLDTTIYDAEGLLLLGENGLITQTPATNGEYSIIIGNVRVTDALEGSIWVDIQSAHLTVEVTDTNGFPRSERAASSLLYNNSTRLFTLSFSGALRYYVLGEKYELTAPVSVNWTDVEGFHAFYFDSEEGVVKIIINPTPAQYQTLILDLCFIGIIYWDAVNKVVVGDVMCERHGIRMSPEEHLYNHTSRGAFFKSGFALGNFVADGTGNLNTNAQFSVEAGVYADEDIDHSLLAQLPVGSSIPVLYLSGANSYLRNGGVTNHAVMTAGSGRLAYNQLSGGVWSTVESPNNSFVLYHIYGFNGVTAHVVSIMGQNTYATLSAARTAASTEIANIKQILPIREIIPIGSIIFETSTGFTNTVKARIRTTDTGASYTDWRVTALATGNPPSDHQNLTNLFLAGSGVNMGHINDQIQTIYGLKNLISGLTIKTKFGFDYLSQTLTNNSSGNIVIGSVLTDKCFFIEYELTRDGLAQIGQMKLTNMNDVYLSHNSEFEDLGFVFTKNLNGNEIRIGWNDDVTTGTNGVLSLLIKKLLI